MAIFSSTTTPSHAMGLMRFPCTEPFHNIYHFMRAGTSLLEEQDVWSTNPLFLTNREAALSPQGRQKVLQAVQKLQENNIQPSQIRHSLAASSMDTACIIRDELKVGQNRINPEFVFMDPRALGVWEGMSYQQTMPAIVALDESEAGPDGREGRPPANDDGTPNETLFDQSTRLRQLMSALETQYSGDTILLVFPDATGPALMSAMIAGVPFNHVHLLDYEPGELRIDVTQQSTLDLFQQKQKQNIVAYMAMVHRGEEELRRLRSLDMTTTVNKKDQLMAQEQRAIETEYQKRKEAQRKKEQEDEQARLARHREMHLEQRKREHDAERTRLSREQPAERLAVEGSNKITKVDSTAVNGGLIAGTLIAGVSLLAFGSNDSREASEFKSTRSVSITEQTVEEDIDMESPTLLRQEEKAPIQLQGSSLYGDTVAMETPCAVIKHSDRMDVARTAMEDYLNQDDGGEDWLSIINEIVQEEVKDDDE